MITRNFKLASLLVLLCTSNAKATNIFLDVAQNIHFHPLDNFTTATFYDVRSKEQLVGVLTDLVTYRFFDEQIGFVKNTQTGAPMQFAVEFGCELGYFIKTKIAPTN